MTNPGEPRVAVVCPACGARGHAPARLAGRPLRCPACGHGFTLVPASPAPTVADTPPAAATVLEPAPAPTRPASPGPAADGPAPTRLEAGPAATHIETTPPTACGPAVTRLDADPAATALDETPAAPPTAAPVAELEIGQVLLDRYRVEALLGEGAMGTVHRVRHLEWDLDLAVKSPRPEVLARLGGAESFETEARTWIGLGLHPHVASCYYVRELEGSPRLFAELVEGGSLADWIEDGRLYEGGCDRALARCLDVAIQLAWGLEAAHAAGVVHQDVKPANALLTAPGAAKVTDFGLARARAAGDGALEVARAGLTEAYASPEQIEGRPLGPASDLWSWAVTVLEMLAGERTWSRGTVAPEVLAALATAGPERPGAPGAPPALATVLGRCFALEPAARPEGLGAVAAELAEIHEGLTGQPYRRHRPQPGGEAADDLNNRALSLADLGHGDEAERLWRQALELDPQHPESLANLGLTRWRAAETTDAELLDDLEGAAAAGRPERVAPLLAAVHLERGDPAAAAAALDRLDDEARRAPEILRLAGRLEGTGNRHPILHWTGSQHHGRAYAAATNADGRVLLTAGDDGRLLRWRPATGALIDALEGPPTAVRSLALSADGRTALSGGADSSARLWDVGDGIYVSTMRIRSSVGVTVVALSADGRLAIIAGDDVLELWEAQAGRKLLAFDLASVGYDFVPMSLALTPDGRRLAVGGSHTVLSVPDRLPIPIFEVASGRLLATLPGWPAGDHIVALDPAGRWLACGDASGLIQILDLESGEVLVTCAGHDRRVHDLVVLDGGRRLLSSSQDGSARLWDAASGRCLHSFRGHDANVWAVACCERAGWLATACGDGTVRGWTLPAAAGRERAPAALCRVVASERALALEAEFNEALEAARREVESSPANALAALRRARAVAGYDRATAALELWRELSRRLRRRAFAGPSEPLVIAAHTREAMTVRLDRTGRRLISVGLDDAACAWDPRDGSRQWRFAAGGPLIAAAVTPDGRRVLVAGSRGLVWILDAETGREVARLEGHSGPIHEIAVSDDGRFAATASSDQTARLWDLASGRCLRRLGPHAHHVTAVAFFPDLARAATGARDGTVTVWDLTTGQTSAAFAAHQGAVHSLRVSRDGRLLLSAGADFRVAAWSADDWRMLADLTGHRDQAHEAALGFDGRLAASASADRTLRLWDLTDGRELACLAGAPHYLVSVDVAADSSRVAAAGFDGSVRVWNLEWQLEESPAIDLPEGAEPYLERFLDRVTPPGELPAGDGEVDERTAGRVLTRRGPPRWDESGVTALLEELGAAGFGRLEPEPVATALERLAGARGGALGRLLDRWRPS